MFQKKKELDGNKHAAMQTHFIYTGPLSALFFSHAFSLQRVSLKDRFRGHSQRNLKSKKGNPHRESKVRLAIGPASDLELLKLLGVGPRAAPREAGPLRL